MNMHIVCFLDCVKVQHSDVLTHALTMLATQGWEKFELLGLI